MKVGYTGPRTGMTEAQKNIVQRILDNTDSIFTEFHHGDCVGGDADFNAICKGLGKRVSHPPLNPKWRAWCEVEEVLPEKDYLSRNQDIAQLNLLIATPSQFKETLRSGTWSTIRYARKAHTLRIIIFPDGTIRKE